MNERDLKFQTTERFLIYLLPFMAFLGLAVPFIFGQRNLILLGSYLALPMFIAPLIYLKIRNSRQTIPHYSEYVRYILICCYLFFFSISILILCTYETRTISYYLAVTLMAVSVLLQILLFNTSKKTTIIILVQIMILILDVVWGANLKYYFFIGRTDLFGHTWMTSNLLNDGFVSNEFEIYKAFPLWHILCAIFNKISSIEFPVYKTAFFLNGIIYSLMMVGTYLVLDKIFHNDKISLLGALFASINPDVIFYGMYSIPRSVVSFLEVILLLLLVARATPKKIILSIVLTFALVVYHPASMPFILVLLLILLLVQKAYSLDNLGHLLSPHYFTFAICLTILYWAFYAERLFRTLITSLLTPAPAGVLTKSIIQTPFNELFNYLQFTPLLIFIIIGSLWILRSEKVSGLGKIIPLLGLLSPIFTFPGPSLLLNKLAAMNFARFGEYSYIFICISAAIGLYCLFYNSNTKIKTATIILFSIMAFLSISNDFTASDNPLIKRPFYTFYLTEQECLAFDHLASCTSGYIMSDYITSRYLLASPYKTKAHILEVDQQKMMFLRQSEKDILLIRNGELKKRPLMLYSASTGPFQFKPSWKSMDYYYRDLALWDYLKKYNKIYESDGVAGYN